MPRAQPTYADGNARARSQGALSAIAAVRAGAPTISSEGFQRPAYKGPLAARKTISSNGKRGSKERIWRPGSPGRLLIRSEQGTRGAGQGEKQETAQEKKNKQRRGQDVVIKRSSYWEVEHAVSAPDEKIVCYRPVTYATARTVNRPN